MALQIIFGDVRNLDLDKLRVILKDANISRLDTAAMYGNGESERKIGRARLPQDFAIDTKIYWQLPGLGSLSAPAIETSLSNSLVNLGVEKVNTLYCHGPDYANPLVEQASAFHDQYQKGRFSQLGVSNLMPDMLSEWLQIADNEGYIQPSVFQGQYNLLCRSYEETLFPLLRQHNMTFNAYSPLAGGFLLGNFTSEGVQAGSRFASANLYTRWYNTPLLHEAVRKLKEISKRTKIGMDELSLRWLAHHSALRAGDGIILGASKLAHVETSTAQLAKGPLDKAIVDELDDLWEGVKEDGWRINDTTLRAFKT